MQKKLIIVIGVLLVLFLGMTIYAIVKSKEADRYKTNMLGAQRKAELYREENEKVIQQAQEAAAQALKAQKEAERILSECK